MLVIVTTQKNNPEVYRGLGAMGDVLSYFCVKSEEEGRGVKTKDRRLENEDDKLRLNEWTGFPPSQE